MSTRCKSQNSQEWRQLKLRWEAEPFMNKPNTQTTSLYTGTQFYTIGRPKPPGGAVMCALELGCMATAAAILILIIALNT